MATAHLLVTLTLDGQTIRVATDSVDVTHARTGRVYAYSAGVGDVTSSAALSLLSDSAPASLPVEVVLPVDLAALAAVGVQVGGSPVEVAIWQEGDDYDRRIVLAFGVVTGAEWGEEGEPLRFSVEAPATVDGAEYPSALLQVNATTWDTVLDLDPSDLGQYYPVVFGQPGRRSDGSWVTAGQIVWFAYPTSGTDFVAIVAGNAANQNYVMLSSDDDVAGAQFAVWQTRDGRAQPVSVIARKANYPTNSLNTYTDTRGETVYGPQFFAWANPVMDAPKTVWMSWISPFANDTGGLSPLAGDVISHVLTMAGVSVDYGGFGSAARLLAGYRLDCVIDTPIQCLQWLRDAVYPLLPVSVVTGGSGDYLVVWQYSATASDAEVVLDADADPRISRAGAIKEDESEIANSFAISYSRSVRTGSYTEILTRDATTCRYCAASEARYGRVERRVETALVYDTPTAGRVLAWMARAYTGPRVRVSYLVPDSYRVQRGAVIVIRDSLVSIDRVALVTDVQVDGSGVDGVELLMVAGYGDG